MLSRVLAGLLLLVAVGAACSDDGSSDETSSTATDAPPVLSTSTAPSNTALPATISPTTQLPATTLPATTLPTTTLPATAVTTTAPFDITAALVGLTDEQADHWTMSDRPVERFEVRVFGTDFVTVPDFPVTMNGCDRRQLRVEWRSLSEAIPAGFTSFLPAGMAVDLLGEAEPATRGDMVLGGCEQPVFASHTDSVIEDLVLEVAQFVPGVGS